MAIVLIARWWSIINMGRMRVVFITVWRWRGIIIRRRGVIFVIRLWM